MSNSNIDRLVLAHHAAIDSLVSVGHAALASAERMAALNLHAVREAMMDFSQGTQLILHLKSPKDAVDLQEVLTRPHVEKSVLYSRSLYEISTATQEEAVLFIENQYNNFMHSMSELANQIAQVTPVGSNIAVAAIRSTMHSANQAFESFNEAVEKFTQVAEDSVSTMGNATVSVATGKSAPKPIVRRK